MNYVVGTLLKSKFLDESPDPALQAGLQKSQLKSGMSTVFCSHGSCARSSSCPPWDSGQSVGVQSFRAVIRCLEALISLREAEAAGAQPRGQSLRRCRS